MSVKKALELVKDTDQQLDEHWWNVSLDWIASQLAEIRKELEDVP